MKFKIIALMFVLTTPTLAGDWPEWGRTPSRNMESPETGITLDFVPGEQMDDSEEIDMATTKNVKWVAKLGSQSYGNTTVAGGRVFIGTNNETPRDPKHKGDRGNVFCLDEKTGELLWQLVVPKLGAGKVSDWEYLGVCSSPAILGDRAYVVTNRCDVLCLDVKGQADGNDGFADEGTYMAGANLPPVEVGPKDADILWVFDMRDELGVFPHNIASSSVLPIDGRLYVTTSNGQDWSHLNIPNPLAPAFICLDMETGELLGEEVSQISERLYHCNWSSPAYGEAGGKKFVIFGAGDGFCYGFDPVPVKDEDDFSILKELWKFDCIPAHYKVKEGKQIKYPSADGPSEIIGTPVFYEGKVYACIGQDPEHGSGVGNLVCINPSGVGNLTESGKVWSYEKIGRSISTPSIADDIVYLAEFDGFIHALDANTGEVYWVHDTKSHIWSSTLYLDGKVLCANEDGMLVVLKAGKEKEVLAEIEFDAPIYSTPVVANGVLYIASQTHLYAIAETGK